jgi:WD40 repeat protein
MRPIHVQPWETTSFSPFGDSRMGGFDQRRCAFSPDGKLLATEDAGGWQLELWDTATGKSLGRFGRIADPVALAFSPDGKTLVTAGSSPHGLHPVELWDVARRERIRGLDDDVNLTPFAAVAFSPDGKTLALAAGPGGRPPQGKPAIHLWDVASGDEIRRLDGIAIANNPGRHRWWFRYFDCLCYSPDGRTLALVTDQQLLLWEVSTNKERCLLGVLPSVHARGRDFGNDPPDITFSPDGRTLAAGCPDGVVRLWDVTAGTELLPLVGHAGAVRAVWFAADGKTLWSFGRDNQALTWPVGEARRPWPRRDKLSAQTLTALWDDLGGEDGLALQEAIRTLAGAPGSAVPFLGERLKPVPAVDSQRIAQLIADLRKNDFNERKRVAVELRKLGDLAIPALRQAQDKNFDPVTRRMLQTLESQYPSREQVQALHALQAVERMGTNEARRLLAELASGASESLLTQQAQAALNRWAKHAALPVGEVKLDTLWADLASEDAGRAFQAVRALSAQSREAMPYLRQRLKVVAAQDSGDDPERIARLIADLDSNEFAIREKATKELSQLGKRAEALLRQALQGTASVEMKRRIDALLTNAAQCALTPERLQAERALEVIELTGTDKARQTLQELARERRNRWLQEAVAESLRRLGGAR